MEYTNLKVSFPKKEFLEFLEEKVKPGSRIKLVESSSYMVIFVKRKKEIIRLNFTKEEERISMMDNYSVKEKENDELIESIIRYSGGDAIKKIVSPERVEIQKIVFGETVRVSRIAGEGYTIVFEKPNFKESDFIENIKSTKVEDEITMTKIKIDNALDCLINAIQAENIELKNNIFNELNDLWKMMIRLEA